ncbi:MAG: helix-turn-helix domain-containing protein [Spirochaetes bacterium]|nr:helix-turn-helix domain-containing protein [Spirochaetota bacterium]
MNRLMSVEEAAEYLGVKVKTIYKWTTGEKRLPFLKLGSLTKFQLADLRAFVEGRVVKPLV